MHLRIAMGWIGLALLWSGGATAQVDASGLERSVVRIVNYAQRGTWDAPWDVSQVLESSGSGFVIEGGLIMTNAHVVSDSRLLVLLLHNDPNPYPAEVVHVAHDCDLALIRPREPGPLEGLPALPFGELPELGSTVVTLGYPAGGQKVSSTRGVVSRIEEQLYVHSGKDVHLAIQTDAAINAGNSGGPVLQGRDVVGVAFQANLGLENAGFVIPGEVIERFLKDVDDGRYDGYPELGVFVAGMENPAIRAQAGLKPGETGVRVYSALAGSSADGLLQVGDVITEVNQRPVANDGSVRDGETRIPFGLLVDRMQVGETVDIRFLRDGRRRDVTVTLRNYPAIDAQGHVYDRLPRYYIYGGLIFVPLELETLKTYGDNWVEEAPTALVDAFLLGSLREPAARLQQRVVLLNRLTHPVNAEMAWYRSEVVLRVNGTPITSLAQLAETLESHQGDHHLIEFATGGRFGVLDRRDADAAHREILERYNVPADRRL